MTRLLIIIITTLIYSYCRWAGGSARCTARRRRPAGSVGRPSARVDGRFSVFSRGENIVVANRSRSRNLHRTRTRSNPARRHRRNHTVRPNLAPPSRVGRRESRFAAAYRHNIVSCRTRARAPVIIILSTHRVSLHAFMSARQHEPRGRADAVVRGHRPDSGVRASYQIVRRRRPRANIIIRSRTFPRVVSRTVAPWDSTLLTVVITIIIMHKRRRRP